MHRMSFAPAPIAYVRAPAYAVAVRKARYLQYDGTRRAFGRRKRFLEAFAAVRPFIERATDARGVTTIHVGFTHPAVKLARLSAHVPGGWYATEGMAGPCFARTAIAPGHFKSVDRPEEANSASHDGVVALVEELERAGAPPVVFASWQFLLRDPRSGGLLPYEPAHFAMSQPISELCLYPNTDEKYDYQLIGYFPWDTPHDDFKAVCRAYDELLPFGLDPRRLEYRAIDDRRRVPGYRVGLTSF